jgi:hypothetical protein
MRPPQGAAFFVGRITCAPRRGIGRLERGYGTGNRRICCSKATLGQAKAPEIIPAPQRDRAAEVQSVVILLLSTAIGGR